MSNNSQDANDKEKEKKNQNLNQNLSHLQSESRLLRRGELLISGEQIKMLTFSAVVKTCGI
jgi:hypothetical protein